MNLAHRTFLLFACASALSLASYAGAAMAQGVPRIKARVIGFDGKLLTLDTGDDKPMTVGLLPNTQIVKQEKRALADLKSGDYAGATFIITRNGARSAQEVHVFPQSLRGNSEGIVNLTSNRFLIGGTVSAAGQGSLTLDYHGSQGADGADCTGRAHNPIVAGVGCQGSAVLTVAPGVPVVALLDASSSLLVPGAVLAISIVAGPEGHPVSPGLTVEGAGAPAEKPPAAPSGPPRR